MRRVLVFYRAARVENSAFGLLLLPSPTHVRRQIY
jgi:hypothetical protein